MAGLAQTRGTACGTRRVPAPLRRLPGRAHTFAAPPAPGPCARGPLPCPARPALPRDSRVLARAAVGHVLVALAKVLLALRQGAEARVGGVVLRQRRRPLRACVSGGKEWGPRPGRRARSGRRAQGGAGTGQVVRRCKTAPASPRGLVRCGHRRRARLQWCAAPVSLRTSGCAHAIRPRTPPASTTAPATSARQRIWVGKAIGGACGFRPAKAATRPRGRLWRASGRDARTRTCAVFILTDIPGYRCGTEHERGVQTPRESGVTWTDRGRDLSRGQGAGCGSVRMLMWYHMCGRAGGHYPRCAQEISSGLRAE